MNITPQTTFTPLATVVNPPTDSLRREKLHREVITQPSAASQSAAEKGVASEKDRAKSPAQNSEAVDFARIHKQAEEDDTTISDSSDQRDENSQNSEENAQNGQQSKAESFVEEQELQNLKQTDLKVRAHERAHSSVGGSLTGAPTYSYELGSDGNKYAVSGEVEVDLSIVEGDPQATIAKMQKVYAAALAPADPSVQDTLVAATASRAILEAQSDILNQRVDHQSSEEHEDETAIRNDGEDVRTNASDPEFDALVKKTLEEQDKVIQERPREVLERASRIENLYSDITNAYEKPTSSQFLLTA